MHFQMVDQAVQLPMLVYNNPGYQGYPSTVALMKRLVEAVRDLKDRLDLNVELATPEDFIPVPPERRRGGVWIADHGGVQFYHYDLVAQALAKIERGHAQDLADAREMITRSLVRAEELRATFERIQPDLPRYPAIDPDDFRAKLEQFLGSA